MCGRNNAPMSQEDLEVVKRGFAQFAETGEVTGESYTADFVWDMSKFRGWPEQQRYEGVEGTRKFLRDWTEAWDDWQLNVESLHDAGEKVVAVMRQQGRSKTTGLTVDMTFAQVWTIRDGKQALMEMYADPAEAFEAVGLDIP
jgi:ketosteroid isomerase-like protein